MADGNGITYTTKELLTQINEKIDRLDHKMDRKVDIARFQVLEGKVDTLYTKIEAAADRMVVERLEEKHEKLANEVEAQNRINKALAEKAREIDNTKASNFTRKEKVIAACVGLAALALQLYVAVIGT